MITIKYVIVEIRGNKHWCENQPIKSRVRIWFLTILADFHVLTYSKSNMFLRWNINIERKMQVWYKVWKFHICSYQLGELTYELWESWSRLVFRGRLPFCKCALLILNSRLLAGHLNLNWSIRKENMPGLEYLKAWYYEKVWSFVVVGANRLAEREAAIYALL
jgi:hypothetical protein